MSNIETLRVYAEIAVYQETGKFPIEYKEKEKALFEQVFSDLKIIGEEAARIILFSELPTKIKP